MDLSTATIDHTITKYLNMIGTARSANTHRTYQNGLQAFKLALSAHNVDSSTAPVTRLREAILGTFLEYLKDYSPATERLYIQSVQGFYKYLMAEEYVNFNLAKMNQIVLMRTRGVGRRLPQFPAEKLEEMIKFYEHIQPVDDQNENIRLMRDRAFILTLADTGLRVHEACNLRRGDIDWHEGHALIIGKGDKQAVIRFSKRSTEALKDYLNLRKKMDAATGRPVPSLPLFSRHDQGAGGAILQMTTTTGREIIKDRAIQALGEQAGITPHAFRHRFVTQVLRGTGNLKLAQELARHSNIQTTERYAHLSDDELDKGYQEVFES